MNTLALCQAHTFFPLVCVTCVSVFLNLCDEKYSYKHFRNIFYMCIFPGTILDAKMFFIRSLDLKKATLIFFKFY